MSIDDNDFNDITDELAFGEKGRADNGESTGGVNNAEEQLRKLLGDKGRTEVEAEAPKDISDTETLPEQPDPAGPEDQAPDASLVNWARKLWHSQRQGYDYASQGRMERETGTGGKGNTGKAVRTILLTVVCLIVGIAAALQFRSVASRNNSEPDSEQQINELLSTINNLHSELGSLEAEKNELQNRLDLAEQSSQDEQIEALREELNSVRTFAGLTTVKGKGIYVQVSFSERTNINIIQNRLLLLINELRACGAQAISINGVRILAMTEIRVVSEQYISVNARQIVGPYEIYAIGDAQDLYNGISMGGSGIGYQIDELSGASCKWFIQENVVVNAASDDDIKTDRLNPNT